MKTDSVPFDENAIGDSLVLTVNDSTLQTAVNVDAHRHARSRFGQTVTQSSVEFYVWSPNAATPSLSPSAGVPPLTVGIVKTTGALNKYVGEDADGYGYCFGDGKIYNNGAAIATFATSTLNTYVTVLVDFIALTATWIANGVVLGSVSIPSGVAIYYAATVSGNPGDLAVWANASQTPPTYPTSAGGWFHATTGIDPKYLATEPYITKPADSPAHWKYSGDIDRMQGQPMSMQRAAGGFWPFGASKPAQLSNGSTIQFTILDPDLKYGELLSLDIRDQLAVIARVNQGDAFSTAENVFSAIIDKCDQTTDQTKTLVCKDKLVLTQSQLIRPMFAPNAATAVQGKPQPMLLGIGRTMDGALFDATNFYFATADMPISGIGKGRSKGVEMGYGIDFNILATAKGFSKTVAPDGKTTWEATTFGGAYLPTLTDLLGGDGVFGSTTNDGGGTVAASASSVIAGTGVKSFTTTNTLGAAYFVAASPVRIVLTSDATIFFAGSIGSYASPPTLTINATSFGGSGPHGGSGDHWLIEEGVNQPHNWIGRDGYTLDFPSVVWQVRGTSPNKYIEQAQKPDAVYVLQHATLTIAAGAAIAYEVVVKQAPDYGNGIDGAGNPIQVPPAVCVFSGFPTAAEFKGLDWARFSVPKAGTYRGAFVNTNGSTLPLCFGTLCNSFISGAAMQITSIKLVALPDIAQNIILDGPGLDWMLQQLMINHGPLEVTDYDSSGAQAIDTATGYKYGLYIKETETPQIQACMKLVLDSACCDVFVNRAGFIDTLQLTAPEDVDPANIADTLTVNDIMGYLQPMPDLAENLRTRMSGCENIDPYTESDFSGVSQTDVPQTIRKLLEQRYQWTVTSNAILAQRYAAAENAAPLESRFDRQEHGQAEITRVCKLYSQPRNFYVGTFFSPIGTQFEIGEVYNVIYPLAGLETGRQLLLLGVNEQPSEALSTLVFWGL